MKAIFLEESRLVHAFPSALIAANEDIFNGNPASDVFSMAEADRAVCLVICNAGASGTAVLTVEACDDFTPSNTDAIPFFYRKCSSGDTAGDVTAATAAGFTIAAGADKVYAVEIDAADVIATGYENCRIQLTEGVNNPVDGAAVVFLLGRRYSDDDGDVLS
jgi:hypothetical protein